MTFIWFWLAVAYGFCMGFMYVCTHDPYGDTLDVFFKRRLWLVLLSPLILPVLYVQYLWSKR